MSSIVPQPRKHPRRGVPDLWSFIALLVRLRFRIPSPYYISLISASHVIRSVHPIKNCWNTRAAKDALLLSREHAPVYD